MTCREFQHDARSLGLQELALAGDHLILDHAGECRKCAGWLQQQRMLAATMQSLRARTAACEAGPNVERALLRAFRQAPSQIASPEAVRRLSPIAFRLSRFFEIGAYAAVAAAIAIALFLGVRLWQQRSVQLPVQSQAVQPSAEVPQIVAAEPSTKVDQKQPVAAESSVARSRPRHVRPSKQPTLDTAEVSQVSTDADYIALMLCDPLSCSSDAQVVRMELPGTAVAGFGAEQDAQMRIADVVVGYDGVVRAVRMVN